nr:unnamed protein product [Callosobruchus chinensis]
MHPPLPVQLRYDLQPVRIPERQVIDYEHVPRTKYPTTLLPNYSWNRPMDRYDYWPKWYGAHTYMPEFRHYLNNLLMRDCGVRYKPGLDKSRIEG